MSRVNAFFPVGLYSTTSYRDFKMRMACSANLYGRPPRRVIHHLKSNISPRQLILIRPVTHNQPTRVLPAHFSRLPSVNISLLSVRSLSTSSPIMLKQTSPVSSPNKPEFKPTTPTTTAPEASTADIAPTTDTSNNDNDKNTDTSSDDDPVVYQQWGPTIHHFVKQIHLAWSSSPRPLTSATKPQIDEFMTCWRSAFDKLAREIEADTSFPQELTTPPVSRFDILLFTQDSGLDCPCCLPIVKSSITLKADDGVGLTKGDFVRAVGGYLYGFETFSESSSSQSKVKVRFNGGEFSQTARGEITLPTIYSEYELLTRAEYPAYLVKKGGQEWTLQEQLRDRERPLGGWPSGFGGASDRNFDDNPSPRALREKGVDREEVDLVEDMGGLNLDAKGQEDGIAPGPEVEPVLHGEEGADTQTEEVEAVPEEEADGEIATDNSQHGADVAPEPSQQDEVDSNASSSAFYEEPAPTEYKFPAVIWDSSWLSAGGRGPNGERIVYGSTPKVWLFCCTPGDFEDRVGTERFIKKRKNWDEAYNKKATDDSEKKEVKNNE